jgi:flagellar basal-body rod protein FlgG
MVYGLWQSAGGLLAQDYQQSVLANNLANVDTPGFKPDRISFAERLNASAASGSAKTRHPVLDHLPGGVFETDVHTDFSAGSFIQSNSPLDVAIAGEGLLAVQTEDGTRYTRDGRFVMSADGSLLHATSGAKAIDGDGRAIYLNTASRDPIRIDPTGRITQGESQAGQLKLVDFVDRSQLHKEGKNLFVADEGASVEASGRFEQGMYEASTADPVSLLVDMIAASRAYQLNANMITMQDETIGRVVNETGRVG